MTALDEVGAITPGTSIPAIISLVARGNGLEVSDTITKLWRSVLDLLCHIDNRVDADYPQCGRGGSPELEHTVVRGLLPYLEVLRNGEAAELGAEGYLNARQLQSVYDTVGLFAAVRVPSDARENFVVSLRQWIRFSLAAKSTSSMREFMALRYAEGIHIGRLFSALLVPPNDELWRYTTFVQSVDVLMGVGQLFDSLVDLPMDYGRGEIQIHGWRIRLALGFVVILRCSRLMIRYPKVTWALLLKTPNYLRNRAGRWNAERDRW